MLKWRIKRADGRYIHCPVNEPGTILFFERKDLASVFEGTRDLVDGICYGLRYSTGDDFQPEHIIHTQKPVNEKVDDIHTGE